jgi:hypothetical protein
MSKKARVSLLLVVALGLGGYVAFADSLMEEVSKYVWDRAIYHTLFPFSKYDEAKVARDAGDFRQSDVDNMNAGAYEPYFDQMDYGITLPANQEALRGQLDAFIPGISADQAARRVRAGRINWIVWTGGNDRFWNYMTRATLGGLDFLKTISDFPDLPSTRSDRWQLLGLVNEPCFTKADGPREDRWGLWLPKRVVSTECPPDPFEDAATYPGVKIGARGTTLKFNDTSKDLEVGSIYGYATGIIGLRLFPNPDFDSKAAAKWDSVRFYRDPAYYYDPNLVRPYRVGMSCAFCHVGPNPSRPPDDFNNPKWANLNSNPGAQYFWVDRIFDWDWKKNQDNFIVQLLRTARPGSLDTSLVSSDMINNPRTMNAVYNLPARVAAAMKFNHLEQLKGNEVLNNQFSLLSGKDVPMDSMLRQVYNPTTARVFSPRVLKDGSDSVGALGALNRVYVNIGLFSEEWVQNFYPLIGGRKISPFRIDVAQQNSLYWNATVKQTPDLALFFLAASRPDKLSDAPGGAKYLKDFNGPDVAAGRRVFARNCAACHSSKLPEKAYTFFNKDDATACIGPNYMACWNSYWNYAKTPEFKDAMEKIVADPHFLDDNYMSTELRVPINLVDSGMCSPIGTNAIRGDIWDNFSSDSYKSLPSAGMFRANYPTANGGMTSAMVTLPDGGRGFFRPASLISVWSSAPFLQNNSLGKFNWYGTVDGRMASFSDSINKLLNPETRGADSGPGKQLVSFTTTFGDQLNGVVDVTTQASYLKIPRGYLPHWIWNLVKNAVDQEPNSDGMISKGKPLLAVDQTPMPRMVVKIPEPKKNWIQRTFASIFGGKKQTAELSSNDDADSANYSSDEMGEFIRLGPIPAGVPVNLISNMDLTLGNSAKGTLLLGQAAKDLVKAVARIKKDNLKGKAATDMFMSMAGDSLLAASRCNDFVVNRGHYFGTRYSPDKGDSGQGLGQDEKAALIEYLKWF